MKFQTFQILTIIAIAAAIISLVGMVYHTSIYIELPSVVTTIFLTVYMFRAMYTGDFA